MSIELKQAAQQAIEALNEAVAFREGGRQKAIDAIHALRTAIQQAESEPVRPDILEKLTYHQFERDDLSLDDCLDYLASGWTTVHGRTDRQMVMQILALLARQRIHPAPGVPAADAEWRDVIQGAIDALPYQHHLIPRLVALLSANRPAPGVPDDAKRLNWLDDTNKRFRMGWEVGQAPAGNVSIRTIITGGKSIRDAIDAAMARSQDTGGAA